MRCPSGLVLVLLLLVGASRAKADDGAPGEAPPAGSLRRALTAGTPAEAARAAWQSAGARRADVLPALVAALEAGNGRPPSVDDWALEQVLLDACVQLRAPVPPHVLIRRLDDHTDTVVLLLVRGGNVPALWKAYDLLDPRTHNEAWWTVGAALLVLDADAFRRRLLEEVRIERRVLVRPTWRGRRKPIGAPRPPPVYERWTERHAVPGGFPPVATWALHHGSAAGREPVHARMGMWASREVHEGLQVLLERTAEDDRPPMSGRLAWLQAPVLGRSGVTRLRASLELGFLYTGPTPFRRWIAEQRRELEEAWWATVVALVETGRLTAAEARALEAPIDWKLLDGRTDGRPPLTPLPPSGVRHPYRKEPQRRWL